MSASPAEPAGPSRAAAGRGINVQACKDDAAGAMRTLLRFVPISLAEREIVRMRALADSGTLQVPLLDVGCGDGLFWEVLSRNLVRGDPRDLEGLVGIDIDRNELRLASARLSRMGGDLRQVDITSGEQDRDMEARRGTFRTILANCSLEHVPRLEVALANIKQYLAPDGALFLFVPSLGWSDTLASKRFLRRVGGSRLAETYAGMIDGFFQHHHLYPSWVWRHLLEGIGFRVDLWGLGSRNANRLYEAWLPPAVLSFAYKSVFKHYPVRLTAPLKSLYLRRMRAFLGEIERGETKLEDPEDPQVYEYFIRCTLPPA